MTEEASNRARRTRSILSAQKQMQRIEERKLVELKRQARELSETEANLVGLLEDPQSYTALVPEVGVRRLSNVRKVIDRVATNSRAQAERLIHQTGRSKLAERVNADAESEVRQHHERRELEEAIERFLRARTASLP